jgi:hypothetical protein
MQEAAAPKAGQEVFAHEKFFDFRSLSGGLVPSPATHPRNLTFYVSTALGLPGGEFPARKL